MNLSNSIQSLKNIVRFPMQDPKWQNKLLIGSLLGLASMVVPIVPVLPLMGYLARVLRSGARDEDTSRLPEWDDWGDLFMDGLRMFGVTFLIMLPATIIMAIGWGIYMVGTVAMSTVQNSYDANNVVGPFLISLLIFFVATAVGMVLSLVALAIMPPAVAHVAVKRRFSALFEFNTWWSILRSHFLDFMVTLVVFAALYMISIFVTQILYMTIILCVLVPFLLIPLSFYSGIILYRLIGQVYGEAAPGEVASAPVDPLKPIAPVSPVPPAPSPYMPVQTPPAPQNTPVSQNTPVPPAAADVRPAEPQSKRSGLETIVLPKMERKEESSGVETIILPKSDHPDQ